MRLSQVELRCLAASVLLAVGAYAATVGHGFVYDDVFVIQQNPDFHSLANWRILLVSPWWGPELYRPFTSLTFAFDWSISGGSPHVMHVMNVILHAITTGLVFVLARGYLGVLGATVAGLLFAVHPVHVEAVANLVGRAEVLATLFTVAAALAYRADGALAARHDRSWRRGLASFGTLLLLWLAMASKESALAATGIFLIVDWLDAKRAGVRLADQVERHLVLWLAAVALTAEFLWLRASVVGGLEGVHAAPGLEGEGLAGRALVMAPVVIEYVRLLVFPLKLSADYSPDFLRPLAAVTVRGLVGLTVLVLAVAVAVRAKDRAPVVTFGLAWVGGTLLVIANILVPTGVLLAERSMYLPSVGAVLALAWVGVWVVARSRYVGIGLVAVLVALGLVRTLTRVPVWRSEDTFFRRLIADAPGSYRSAWVASALAYREGRRLEGEALALRALRIQPIYPNLWEYMGRRYEEDERWLEAANALNASFRLDSTRMLIAADAIVNYVRAGALDSAMQVGRRARRQEPDDYRVMIALSDLALARGRPLEAMTWRRRVAWQFPHVWQYWYLTAQAAILAPYCPEAERSLERLRALRPELPYRDPLVADAREAGCHPTR